MDRLDMHFDIDEKEGVITCTSCTYYWFTFDQSGADWEREALAHVIALHITVKVG